jgi:hypothetical protein
MLQVPFEGVRCRAVADLPARAKGVETGHFEKIGRGSKRWATSNSRRSLRACFAV